MSLSPIGGTCNRNIRRNKIKSNIIPKDITEKASARSIPFDSALGKRAKSNVWPWPMSPVNRYKKIGHVIQKIKDFTRRVSLNCVFPSYFRICPLALFISLLGHRQARHQKYCDKTANKKEYCTHDPKHHYLLSSLWHGHDKNSIIKLQYFCQTSSALNSNSYYS